MMKILRPFIFACFGFMLAAVPAQAQWRAVASCPGATAIQPAGTSGAIALVDVNGNLCISGSGSLPAGAATAANQNIGVNNVTAALSGMTANNAATQITLQGTNSAAVLLSGAWVGTLTPQVSADGGTTWANAYFLNSATCAITATVTANGTYGIWGAGGMTHARVLLSPYTSGTVTGNLSATSQAASDALSQYCLSLTTGTAGSPSSAVVTMQGIIGMTPVTTQGASTGGSFPTSATAIGGNATGTTGAVVGTLAGASSKTTYLCDFDVSALGTAASVGPVVVAGLLGGSRTYQMGTLATGVQQMLTKNFNPCLPASTTNTAITITTTADATASAVDVNSSGYQQ